MPVLDCSLTLKGRAVPIIWMPDETVEEAVSWIHVAAVAARRSSAGQSEKIGTHTTLCARIRILECDRRGERILTCKIRSGNRSENPRDKRER
jgi:hypothetical protein